VEFGIRKSEVKKKIITKARKGKTRKPKEIFYQFSCLIDEEKISLRNARLVFQALGTYKQ